MSIQFDGNYKNKIGCKITLRFSDAIRDHEIPDEEIEEVANYVIVALNQIDNLDDCLDFLEKLAARWPCFSQVHQEQLSTISTVNDIQNTFISRSGGINN